MWKISLVFWGMRRQDCLLSKFTDLYYSLFLIKNLLCTIFVWKKNQVFSAEVSLNISWQVHENFVNKILLNTVNTVLLMNSLHESNCSIVTERLFLYISFNLPLNGRKKFQKTNSQKLLLQLGLICLMKVVSEHP